MTEADAPSRADATRARLLAAAAAAFGHAGAAALAPPPPASMLAITAPTDRSIPAVRITSVCAAPTMPTRRRVGRGRVNPWEAASAAAQTASSIPETMSTIQDTGLLR